VSADRKGPLAAFIVIAIIAAILLVTSVRSQAATGWLNRALPSAHSVVHAVDGRVERVVAQGSALVRATTSRVSVPPSTHSAGPSPAPVSQPTARPADQPSSLPAPPAVRHHVTSGPSTTGSPGRHLGWTHAGHVHAVPANHADRPGHPVHPAHAVHPDHADRPGHPDHPEYPDHVADERY
jgi:hypothetical protein